eukprot:2953789-Pyramimonas_sp.AAC.1
MEQMAPGLASQRMKDAAGEPFANAGIEVHLGTTVEAPAQVDLPRATRPSEGHAQPRAEEEAVAGPPPLATPERSSAPTSPPTDLGTMTEAALGAVDLPAPDDAPNEVLISQRKPAVKPKK